MSNILSCEGCWKEKEPCIIRICGEAPLSTAADRDTLDKCRLHKRKERTIKDDNYNTGKT